MKLKMRPKPAVFATAVAVAALVSFFVLRALAPAPVSVSAPKGEIKTYTAYFLQCTGGPGPIRVTVESGGHTVSQVLDFSHPTFTFQSGPDGFVSVEKLPGTPPGNAAFYTFREGTAGEPPKARWACVSEGGTSFKGYKVSGPEFSYFITGQGTPPEYDVPVPGGDI